MGINTQLKGNLLKFMSQKHPVLAILGDPELNLNYVLSELNDIDIDTELEIFEFTNRESLKKLDEFLLLFSANLKIAICIFANLNQNLISGILKKIEDVPEKTCFMLLAHYFPETILNRAFLINSFFSREEIDWVEKILEKWDKKNELILNPPNNDRDMNVENQAKIFKAILIWFEKKLLSKAKQDSKENFLAGYKIWERLVEIEFWFDSKQITINSGIEMILSILAVSDHAS